MANDLDPPHPRLGLVEIRAWARASQRIAQDEGFVLTSDAVGKWIDWFDKLNDAGVFTVSIVPESDAVAQGRQRLKDALDALVDADELFHRGGTDNMEIKSIRDDLAEEMFQIAKEAKEG